MCLIVHCPKDIELPESLALRSFNNNPHGWGVMYAKNGKVLTARGLGVADYLDTLDRLKDEDFVVHTRVATHGDINIANTHPFKVTKNVYMMHNGIISNYKVINPRMSDSWHFAKWLAPIVNGGEILDDKDFIDVIGRRIGKGNKIVLLRGDGKVFIVNEDQGVEYKNMWLSNDYSIWAPPPMSKREKRKLRKQQGNVCAIDDTKTTTRQAMEDIVKDIDQGSLYELCETLQKLSPRYYGLNRVEAEYLGEYYSLLESNKTLMSAESNDFYRLCNEVKQNMQADGLTREQVDNNFKTACVIAGIDPNDDLLGNGDDSPGNIMVPLSKVFSEEKKEDATKTILRSMQESTAQTTTPVTKAVTSTSTYTTTYKPYISKEDSEALLLAADRCGIFTDKLGDEENAFWNDRLKDWSIPVVGQAQASAPSESKPKEEEAQPVSA